MVVCGCSGLRFWRFGVVAICGCGGCGRLRLWRFAVVAVCGCSGLWLRWFAALTVFDERASMKIYNFIYSGRQTKVKFHTTFVFLSINFAHCAKYGPSSLLAS